MKQLHLAVHYPGVGNSTVWADPLSGSNVEFSSFARLAQTAERAKFDFFFLAEGLRLREQQGQIYDLDVIGRPDSFTVLAALAAVTGRIGLSATISSTFNEPYDVARKFATLDHLSAGRSGWNVVTSWDGFTGANFRRGGYLAEADRYTRARSFLETVQQLWDSWSPNDLELLAIGGQSARAEAIGAFDRRDAHFDIRGRFTVPRPPQGRPVIIQAGDSDEGREFAAAEADVIFTRHGSIDAGQAFYADVKRRLGAYGREPTDLKVMPAVTFVLGDNPAEAEERSRQVRRQQVSGATALKMLERVWNQDLSSLDPDGPVPEFDPVVDAEAISRGNQSVRQYRDPVAVAGEWRERARAEGLSIRELAIRVTGRQSFVGPPEAVAAQLNEYVQQEACDGFVIEPHITPGGLDEFADRVVPLLQERGVFRAEYEGTSLREHLGLHHPDAR